jgi:branched-chain amino acid transport system ATP-binding protein
LNAVSGAVELMGGQITGGEVWFDGEETTGTTTDRLVHKGLSLVPEHRHVFPTMTVLENIEMGGYILKRRNLRKNVDRVLAVFPHLQSRLGTTAGALSTGEQQMVALARGLMICPKLLLADEPSLGLSPSYVDIVFERIREINRTGTSVILAEQNVPGALQLAHRVYVFDRGSVVVEGEPRALEGKWTENRF